MKRNFATLVLACLMAFSFATAQPAAAQDEGCKEFGLHIVSLTQDPEVDFGQITASLSPANDTVVAEQEELCF